MGNVFVVGGWVGEKFCINPVCCVGIVFVVGGWVGWVGLVGIVECVVWVLFLW